MASVSRSASVAAAAAFPDFSVTACLKDGDFGKVCLAQTECGAKLIVKEMQISLTSSARRNEQKSLMMAPHTFVLPHRGCVDKAAVLATAFDYCPGGDLAQLVGAGALAEKACQFYLTEITLALSHLHNLGIVHCDLKPSNVLLDLEGHVQVADFSIIDPDVLADYGVKTAFGAPEFIAPEILKGSGACRGADWYSVGALTCYMLSGKVPFDAEEGSLMLTHIFQGKLALDKSMSIKARNFITTTMRLEPAARLGASDGDGDDVRAHMFFAGADVAAVRHRQVCPPFRPQQVCAPLRPQQEDELSSAPPKQEDELSSAPSGRVSLGSMSTGRISIGSSVSTGASSVRRFELGCAGIALASPQLRADDELSSAASSLMSARTVASVGASPTVTHRGLSCMAPPVLRPPAAASCTPPPALRSAGAGIPAVLRTAPPAAFLQAPKLEVGPSKMTHGFSHVRSLLSLPAWQRPQGFVSVCR